MRTISVQVPSVGRVVMYHSYGTPKGEYKPEPRAAVITEVDLAGVPTSNVGLCVLNPTGLFFNRQVPYGVDEPGCWSWPPYMKNMELETDDDYQVQPGEKFVQPV